MSFDDLIDVVAGLQAAAQSRELGDVGKRETEIERPRMKRRRSRCSWW
jgi:hypothetical protein